MAMSLFPFMMEPQFTSSKTTTYRSEKLHLQPNQVKRGEEADQR
jgi:hypothetical protein